MTQRTQADSPTKVCTHPDCERPLRAKGLCVSHYNNAHGSRKYVDVECPTCGEVSRKRDDGASTRRFCSFLCRDLWTCDQPASPRPGRPKRVSRLPADHPVRQLIQLNGRAKAAVSNRRGPLRIAVETGDWPTVAELLERDVVKVDGCWLWSRQRSKEYGKVSIGPRDYFVHRLMMAATLDGRLDPTLPVHHRCAETLCCNPDHLQLVTHRENTAEMLERRYYVKRIALLEASLRSVAPSHPALTPWDNADVA